MKIHKQIEEFFNKSPIPVYVPGIDIQIDENETIYTASKSKKEFVENPAWDYDSVSKSKMIEKITVKTLKFVIRNNQVYLIGFKVI